MGFRKENLLTIKMSPAGGEDAAPSSVTAAVLKPSHEMPKGSQKVEELDFNAYSGRSITVEELVDGMKHMGFQASSIGEAVRIISEMVCRRRIGPLPAVC